MKNMRRRGPGLAPPIEVLICAFWVAMSVVLILVLSLSGCGSIVELAADAGAGGQDREQVVRRGDATAGDLAAELPAETAASAPQLDAAAPEAPAAPDVPTDAGGPEIPPGCVHGALYPGPMGLTPCP